MIYGEDTIWPILIFDEEHNWDSLPSIAYPHLERDGLTRIVKVLGDQAKSVIVEKHYIDKDYRNTFSQYHSKRFSTPDSRCVRLHFFSSAIEGAKLPPQDDLQSYYLGYTVIRPTRPNCVGRTLIRYDVKDGIEGSIIVCKEDVTIQGTTLSISGFPFISQDVDATVCAESSVWMLSRYFSNKYNVYHEMYPAKISNLLRKNSDERAQPSVGLYAWEMAEALRELDFSPLIYDRETFEDNFDHLLYTYIESGIPVLAVFEEHVVVLFGHKSEFALVKTLDPLEGQTTIRSSQYNRAFIGHDDNGVPYQMLQVESCDDLDIEMNNGKVSYITDDIDQFVTPLPEKVFLPAEGCQEAIEAILESDKIGITALSPALSDEPVILRLLLTTGRSFKKRIAEREMGNADVADIYLRTPLPHFIWVCEFSHKSLYPEQVLGEIVWDATRNAYEPDGWIALHYPEVMIVDQGTALNTGQFLVTFPLDGSVPYPIYRNNLEDIS